jgi:hypothetical protein
MAAALALPPSTVQSWKSSGLIPARHHARVLARARELNLALRPEDFFAAPAAGGSAA